MHDGWNFYLSLSRIFFPYSVEQINLDAKIWWDLLDHNKIYVCA